MVRASCGRCITTPAYNLLFRRSYSSSAPPFPAPPSFTSAADAISHSKSTPTSKAAELFEKERERQRSLISRVEKIEVRFLGAPQDCSLLMNKNLSTPNDCARHMAEKLMKRSAVAEIDGKVWDMHRPLEHNCVMRLISLDTPDKALQDANTAFWRSCTLVLGAVASNAFKDEIKAIPHSFPPPNVRSGSFVYDVVLDGLKEWNPTKDELRLLSTQMVKIAKEDHPFEYLKVRLPAALEIMADNPFKVNQLPKIAETTDGDVTLYRMGDYVDVSKGPMISRTSFLGRCTVTSVQRIKTGSSLDLYRFQGVALPNSILLNHFAYGLIEERGRKFNGGRLPEVAAAIS